MTIFKDRVAMDMKAKAVVGFLVASILVLSTLGMGVVFFRRMRGRRKRI